METTPIEDPRLLSQLRWLIIYNQKMLCNLTERANKNDVLIVKFNRYTRLPQTAFSGFDKLQASLDNARLLEDLQRLHNRKEHYTVIAYLDDNDGQTLVCIVVALRCDGTATSF